LAQVQAATGRRRNDVCCAAPYGMREDVRGVHSGRQVWKVVGGTDRGGVVVREGEGLISHQTPARLSTGALVVEVELVGDRLRYERISGSGPDVGWVSVRLSGGKELLTRVDVPKTEGDLEPKGAGVPSAPTAAPAPTEDRPTPPPQRRPPRSNEGLKTVASDQRLRTNRFLQVKNRERLFADTGSKALSTVPQRAAGALHDEAVARVYEIVRAACSVHAEPHLEADILAIRSQGARILCNEVTMNGWLKLVGEPGWVLARMHGAGGDGQLVAQLIGEEAAEVAVREYQPQGVCCLEVVAQQGVHICAVPGDEGGIGVGRRKSPAAADMGSAPWLAPGEYVFARSQTFDGWLRLLSGEGWVCARSLEDVPLLRPRDTEAIEHTDLWALSDAWTAARRARGLRLSSDEVRALKQLEELVAQTAATRFAEYRVYAACGNAEAWLQTRKGLLTREQLQQPAVWFKQHLYTSLLSQKIRDEAVLQQLVPHFALSPHVPPLPLPEEEHSYGDVGFWSAGYLPFNLDGETCMIAPDGVIVDPRSLTTVGVWSTDAHDVARLAVVEHGGVSFLAASDGLLMDSETLEPVGVWNADTRQIDPIDAALPLRIDELDKADVPPFGGEVEEEEEKRPVGEAIQQLLERARGYSDLESWEASSRAYTAALAACERTRAVDLDLEREALRGRAECWLHLARHDRLLADAERLLSYDGADAEAEDLRLLASSRLGQEFRQRRTATAVNGERPADGLPCDGALVKRMGGSVDVYELD